MSYIYLTIILLLFTVFIGRICFKIPSIRQNQDNGKKTPLANQRLMVLLGSGGHTGEILRMLETIQNLKTVKDIIWCISSGDSTSIVQLKKFLKKQDLQKYNHIVNLPRARKVGESWGSSIISTLNSFFFTFKEIISLNNYPDTLIVNGPGTVVPLCYLFLLLNIIGLSNTKILYIESLARVNDLSLSGKLCYLISNKFIVQWPQLTIRYPKSEYHGILV